MSEVKLMNSLKDIINIKCDEFKDKAAFIEKNPETREFFKVSYSKVKDDVNALGTYMIKKLNLKDQKIAVIGESSYRWYETYMAVVCGVGVIVPLDKELPDNEILNLIKRSDAKCIVYSSRKKEIIDNIKKELPEDFLYIDMNKEKSDKDSYSYDDIVKKGKNIINKGDNFYSEIEIDREKMCSLLFTSGTTSEPKGVMLSHKNLVTNIYACYNVVPTFGNYTCLSILPLHHTYEFTLGYLFMTSVGGTIGVCEGIKYITKDIKEIKPDFILAVPALIEKISEKIDKRIKETKKELLIRTIGKVANGLSKIGIDFRKKIFAKIHETFGGNLKYIFCGAAPLDKELINKMEGYGFRFLQGYGLTECSPLLAGTSLEGGASGTVGKAVYGVEVRIDLSENVDENSNIGEIIAKGDSIMLGYYKDEAATKKAIRNGWFYTGDVGYFDLRGNLVVTGRCKNIIVTSNGKKIFPEEIENLINKIPLVKESMVYPEEYEGKKLEVIVSARVTLDEDYIKETYGNNRPTDLQIYDMIWKEIKNINKTLVSYKAVKRLEIKDEDFIKTTTMKIKRFEEMKKIANKKARKNR